MRASLSSGVQSPSTSAMPARCATSRAAAPLSPDSSYTASALRLQRRHGGRGVLAQVFCKHEARDPALVVAEMDLCRLHRQRRDAAECGRAQAQAPPGTAAAAGQRALQALAGMLDELHRGPVRRQTVLVVPGLHQRARRRVQGLRRQRGREFHRIARPHALAAVDQSSRGVSRVRVPVLPNTTAPTAASDSSACRLRTSTPPRARVPALASASRPAWPATARRGR